MHTSVYHASSISGLREIQPHISSHSQPWVYAAWDMAMAAAFLGTLGGDFTCTVGRDEASAKVFICERLAGAFALRYAGVSGSIYVLPGDDFQSGKTQWDEEVVCSGAVKPLREIYVADAQAYLVGLADAGDLLLRYYPEKIAYIPDDDADLVFRAAMWYRQSGEKVIARVRAYHPGLLARVWQAIEQDTATA